MGGTQRATEDLDGDGVNDIFIGVPVHDVGTTNGAGRVYLLSGRTRTVIATIDSPQVQQDANFGFFISVLGDVNGDDKDDLAVGTDSQSVYTGSGAPSGAPEPNGCNEGLGRARVFSGATRQALQFRYRLGEENECQRVSLVALW